MKPEPPPPFVHVRLQTDTVIVGEVRCAPDHPEFARETVADVWPSIAFPRSPIGFRYLNAGGAEPDPVIGDCNTAVLFNVGRRYRRIAIDPRGSCTDWIEVRPELLAEMVEELEPGAKGGEAPFVRGHAPCPSGAYLAQRLNRTRLLAGLADPLEVEETSLAIARAVLRALHAQMGRLAPRRRALSPLRARFAADAVRVVRQRLAVSLMRCPALADLAREVHLSPFHLCRLFRRHTGTPIHKYFTRLRLRAALELIAEPHARLADVAARVGYGTESHFSHAFTCEFGLRPSAFRKARDAASTRDAIHRALRSLN